MNKVFIFLLLVIISGIFGCEKAKNINSGFPEGTYTGTFQRLLPEGDPMVSNVMISFSEGTWSGQSDLPKYPALCNGTFTTKKDRITFENSFAWTADFDWSLILSGDFNFLCNGDSLIISKANLTPYEYHDVYRLRLTPTGIRQSPMHGIWVETLHKTDTIVFSPEYDGTFPVFNLNRSTRISEGYTLPGYYSGPYWYTTGINSISINWFLSDNSLFARYYFRLFEDKTKFEIGNFFTDPGLPPVKDTLTFVKIKE